MSRVESSQFTREGAQRQVWHHNIEKKWIQYFFDWGREGTRITRGSVMFYYLENLISVSDYTLEYYTL